MGINWTIKSLISLMHGITMKSMCYELHGTACKVLFVGGFVIISHSIVLLAGTVSVSVCVCVCNCCVIKNVFALERSTLT